MSGDDARAEVLARVAGALAAHGKFGPEAANAVMRSVVDGVLGELEEARGAVERAVALRDEARGQRDQALADMRLARNEAADLLARLKQAEAERDAARAAWLVVGEPVEMPGDGYAPRHARRGGALACGAQ